jgi:mono/diheme cytochrome c family protein
MRILLALIGALAIAVAIVAGGFFLGGFFNVAATEEDHPVVKWALIHVRTASIDRHAGGTPPMKLDDPAVVRDGARAFARAGCANCHGAPGVEWAKFSEGLNPDPPDLKEAVSGSEPARIFWAVKNGIRMTGMPSFAKAGLADNDIWQVVAFVKALPKVSEADYKSWTAPGNQ